jgi:hypothetical protein
VLLQLGSDERAVFEPLHIPLDALLQAVCAVMSASASTACADLDGLEAYSLPLCNIWYGSASTSAACSGMRAFRSSLMLASVSIVVPQSELHQLSTT